ncbi:MAG: UTP--glucose-1-phosphate uridylyltransferase [Alphaproteobacteria bacterium]|nr:UTP--glucose-1-phosphate uridylyltransferase [Alphaproteobacteria bacterium]
MPAPLRKVVFPVAGLGTRFLPATKAVAKEMLPVVDKPLIQYAVEEAAAAGIEEFIIVTAPDKPAIADHFAPKEGLERQLAEKNKSAELAAVRACTPAGARFHYAIQEQPLGLGHAVGCARALVGDEPFAVILPDDMVLAETPCLKQMAEVYGETGGNVIAVEDVPREQTARYGILDVGADDGRLAEVRGLVEKPAPDEAPSTLSIIGRYILLPEVFAQIETVGRGAGGEIQLTDAMAGMIGAAPFHGLRFTGTRYDCGSKLGFLEANIAYALARPEMRDGVRAMLAEHKDLGA